MGQYDDLANAIIEQAVADHRNAFDYIRKNKGTNDEKKKGRIKKAKEIMAECEEFFLGDWFKELTNLNGAELLKQLKEEEETAEAVRYGVHRIR